MQKKQDKKLAHFFSRVLCGAKLNLAFSSKFKNVADVTCRDFSEQESNMLLDPSIFAVTKYDFKKLKVRVNKIDIGDLCNRKESRQSGDCSIW